jgi:hypothetical protein
VLSAAHVMRSREQDLRQGGKTDRGKDERDGEREEAEVKEGGDDDDCFAGIERMGDDLDAGRADDEAQTKVTELKCVDALRQGLVNCQDVSNDATWKHMGAFLGREGGGECLQAYLVEALSMRGGLRGGGVILGRTLMMLEGIVDGDWGGGWEGFEEGLLNAGVVFSEEETVRDAAAAVVVALVEKGRGKRLIEGIVRGNGGGEDGEKRRVSAAVCSLKQALKRGCISSPWMQRCMSPLVAKAFDSIPLGGPDAAAASNVLSLLPSAAYRSSRGLQRLARVAYGERTKSLRLAPDATGPSRPLPHLFWALLAHVCDNDARPSPSQISSRTPRGWIGTLGCTPSL